MKHLFCNEDMEALAWCIYQVTFVLSLFQVLHFAGAVHCSFWEASLQECHCEWPCPCQVGVNQLLPEQVFSQRMFQIRPANCKWNVKWT